MTQTGFLAYFERRLLTALALGFSSGLPLSLTFSTLSLWLASVDMAKDGVGVSNSVIGLFSLTGLAYSFKFLWSPLVDAARFPLLHRLLGRRRGWLLGVQALLLVAIIGLGLADPAEALWLTALMSVTVATLSATQDIIIDALRVEMLPTEQQGMGAAMGVLGYRLGMAASAAGALYLADAFGWQMAYFCMAMLMVPGMLACLLAPRTPEPVVPENVPLSIRFRDAVWLPLRDFTAREGWKWLLAFALLYRLADAFLGVMANPFYKQMGYTLPQIADAVKLFGLGATLLGGLVGGWLVKKHGVIPMLWVGGALSVASNLLYLLLYNTAPDSFKLALVVSMDNIAGALATTALVAWMASLCNLRFTATQYALLSSLAAVGRNVSGAPAGFVADALGWPGFFVVSALLGLPGLWMLKRAGRYRPAATG